jgi:hypothetical protein
MATTDTTPRTNRRRDTRKLFVWLNQVKADAELSPVAFLVAYEIGQHFNARHGGAAWPSSLSIATNIRMSERSVIRAAKLLAQRGHLKIDPGKAGRGHSNQYFMVLQKGAAAHLKPVAKPAPAQVSKASRKPASVALKPAPAQENYLEPSMGPPSAVPIDGRENGSRALTVIPAVALAGGGAPEGKEVAVDRFADLWALWSSARLINKDQHKAEAWRVFAIVCRDEAPHDEIMSRARRYLAGKADDRQRIYQLADWLSNDNWRKPPPSPQPQRNGGKVSLSSLALEIGGRS